VIERHPGHELSQVVLPAAGARDLLLSMCECPPPSPVPIGEIVLG
jgi:hypothetical protein